MCTLTLRLIAGNGSGGRFAVLRAIARLLKTHLEPAFAHVRRSPPLKEHITQEPLLRLSPPLRIKKAGASEGISAPLRGADASLLGAAKRSLSIGRDHFLSLVTRGSVE
jgi:hypothetical protein